VKSVFFDFACGWEDVFLALELLPGLEGLELLFKDLGFDLWLVELLAVIPARGSL
jgi:hypothetical protein